MHTQMRIIVVLTDTVLASWHVRRCGSVPEPWICIDLFQKMKVRCSWQDTSACHYQFDCARVVPYGCGVDTHAYPIVELGLRTCGLYQIGHIRPSYYEGTRLQTMLA